MTTDGEAKKRTSHCQRERQKLGWLRIIDSTIWLTGGGRKNTQTMSKQKAKCAGRSQPAAVSSHGRGGGSVGKQLYVSLLSIHLEEGRATKKLSPMNADGVPVHLRRGTVGISFKCVLNRHFHTYQTPDRSSEFAPRLEVQYLPKKTSFTPLFKHAGALS